jgi:hypothetical protein
LAPLQRGLDDLVGLALGDAPVELHARDHVLVDGHRRERVRALEHHADLPADVDRVGAAGVDVVVVQRDPALDPRPGITSCMRLMVRSAVDLPQPDGPMKAVIDRSSMTIDRSSIARNLP